MDRASWNEGPEPGVMEAKTENGMGENGEASGSIQKCKGEREVRVKGMKRGGITNSHFFFHASRFPTDDSCSLPFTPASFPVPAFATPASHLPNSRTADPQFISDKLSGSRQIFLKIIIHAWNLRASVSPDTSTVERSELVEGSSD